MFKKLFAPYCAQQSLRSVDTDRSQTCFTREDFIPLKAKHGIRSFAESELPKT